MQPVETPSLPAAPALRIGSRMLARNTLLNLIGRVAPLVVGIVTMPYVIRHLGPDRFGLLSLAWMVVGYFALFDLGIGPATTKFVAELFGKGEMDKLPELVWTALASQTCMGLAAGDGEAWKRNLTVANSDWSARLLRLGFGIEARTVYPPVSTEFPAIPWEQRQNGFVCIGRVMPEKRMDAVIRILEKVREAGHDIHLHILGALDDSPFGKKLQALAARRAWVALEGRTFGRKKRDLMAGHRFGINGRENEPFGIAPAELVKAGRRKS